MEFTTQPLVLVVIAAIIIISVRFSKSPINEFDVTINSTCHFNGWLGDGLCDDEANTEICNYDTGDCCLGYINDHICQDCHCHMSPNITLAIHETSTTQDFKASDMTFVTLGSTTTISTSTTSHTTTSTTTTTSAPNTYIQTGYFDYSDCDYLWYVRDSYCDKESTSNNPECNWDGGDCCGYYGQPLWSALCMDPADCKCLHWQDSCPKQEYMGDYHCDDLTNIPECNFDAFDCCRTCVDTSYCSDCHCHEWAYDCNFNPYFIGDGICDDEANILGCDFDRGDCCCGDNCDFSFCQECQCLHETCDQKLELRFEDIAQFSQRL